MADNDRCGIYEKDSGHLPFTGLNVTAKGNQRCFHQFNETVITDEMGKSPFEMDRYILGEEMLGGTKV